MNTKRYFWVAMIVLPALFGTAGCEEDERLARLSAQAADRQARQNEQMAKVTNEVAEGSRKLVEADAQARKEIVQVHHELQAERQSIGQQRDVLEAERKAIVQDRRTESILVPVAKVIGGLLLGAVVIGFCWTLLYGLRKTDQSDAELAEILIQEIVSERPKLLPPSPSRAAILADELGPGATAQLPTDTR